MDAIDQYGAVSDIVASAMAEGALALSKADISLSVTGIAGPQGGTKDKPVGLVYLSIAKNNTDAIIKKYIFAGWQDLQTNKLETCFEALSIPSALAIFATSEAEFARLKNF